MTAIDPKITVIIPTFEDGARAAEAARAILSQNVDAGALEVLIVDDGSRHHPVSNLIEANETALVRVVALGSNAGRSAARNRGASEARGRYLIFMDSDCLPVSPNFVAHHCAVLDAGHTASCGDIRGPDDTFWSRYQATSSERRRRAFTQGRIYMGTSQNLAVRKHEFLAAGGFDTAYRQYGFEDRDLLIRIGETGRVGWADNASVIHRDELDLRTVLLKLREAGASGAGRFRTSHPEAYRDLGYGRADVSNRAARRVVVKLVASLVFGIAPALDRIATKGWLPFPVAAWLVRATSAVAFASGTSTRR